ncbi:MAG: TonB-dependent receptor plug domain-containing protein, partial [Bacteroidia bacterium]
MPKNPRLYKFLLLVIFIAPVSFSYGQSTGTLKGLIRDADKKQPLIGASVFELENKSNAAVADVNGNYELKLNQGKHNLVCTYVGMLADTFNMEIDNNQVKQHDILLKLNSREMNVVVISASKYEQRLEDVTVSMQLIQPRMIESKNTVNIKTALEQSPGLTILDEEPQMRGGSGFSFGVGSRVATLIDGLPILTGDAGRTDWSFIPTENIEQIEIVEGASSVLYGSSALSGTINFRTRYPKDSNSTYIRSYTGFYSTPQNDSAKWWDGAANFSGLNFSHAQKLKQSDLIVGGQLNYDHNYIGPYILDGSLPIKA